MLQDQLISKFHQIITWEDRRRNFRFEAPRSWEEVRIKELDETDSAICWWIEATVRTSSSDNSFGWSCKAFKSGSEVISFGGGSPACAGFCMQHKNGCYLIEIQQGPLFSLSFQVLVLMVLLKRLDECGSQSQCSRPDGSFQSHWSHKTDSNLA